MKNINIVILTFLITTCILSCTKKDYLDQHKTYYGVVDMQLTNLPGTPALEVRYQGKKVADLPTHFPFTLEVIKDAKLSVYVTGTDKLVADTTLNLKRNDTIGFRVAYNEELGISGWLNSRPVAADSMSVQFLNNLVYYNQNYHYDLHLIYYNYDTGDFSETGIVINDFDKVKMSQPYMIPYYSDKVTQMPYLYLCRIWDKATGSFLVLPSGNDFFLIDQYLGGYTLIYNMAHDADNNITGVAIAL